MKKGRPATPKYLTPKQVAARYGMTVKWVYGCRSLPRRKIGRYVRFLQEELEIWEKRHTSKRTTYTFNQDFPQPVQRKNRAPKVDMSDKELNGGRGIIFDVE